MGERLVVVGADAAGMTAASQARRRSRSLEVVAFEKGGYASYAACGEPYYVSGDVDPLDQLIMRTPDQFIKAGVDYFNNCSDLCTAGANQDDSPIAIEVQNLAMI